jgi:hypothetical protein
LKGDPPVEGKPDLALERARQRAAAGAGREATPTPKICLAVDAQYGLAKFFIVFQTGF